MKKVKMSCYEYDKIIVRHILVSNEEDVVKLFFKFIYLFILIVLITFIFSCKKITDPILDESIFKIAFTSMGDSTWDIFLVNSDGTGLTNFTDSNFNCTLPQFAPNGKSILYHALDNLGPTIGTVDDWIIKGIGNNYYLTLLKGHTSEPDFCFSPDGLQLVFSYTGSIFLISSDGSNLKRIKDIGDSFYMQPIFSPDGLSILFHNSSSIYTIDLNGSNLKVILDKFEYFKNPQYSHDGSKILFENNSSIKIINLNHDFPYVPETIIESSETITNVQISPNDSFILYQTSVLGDWFIYSANIDGQNIKKLTVGELPYFSSDGNKIVYKYQRDIYIMNSDGSNKKRLTFDGAWSHVLQPIPK